MQYDDPYDDPYGQDYAEEDETPKKKGDDSTSVVSILLADQILLAKAAGALVCFIIALMLAVSTVFMVLRENQVRDAVRLYYGGSQTKSSAKKPTPASIRRFLKLAQENPDNLAVQLLYAEKLRANQSYEDALVAFENATLTTDHIGEGYLGQAAVHLDMAVAKPADQKTSLQAARTALENIDDDSIAFDKSVMLAAASLLEGDANKAKSILEAVKSDLDENVLVPNRAALEAFEYNLGVAQLFTGSQECIASLRRAAQRRGRWPSIGPVLKNACIIVMQQSDDFEKNQKLVDEIKPILNSFIRPARRGQPVSFYALTIEDCAEVYNAMGLAMYRLKKYLLASTLFEEALKRVKAAQKLPYRINMANALRQAGLATKVGKAREELFKKAAKQFRSVYGSIRKDTEQKALANQTLKQMIELQFRVRKFNEITKGLKIYRESGDDTAEAYRLEGIMQEMNKRNRAAKRAYRLAIEANHPDSEDLEVRIEALGGE